jgi:Uma2 family endonuclease
MTTTKQKFITAGELLAMPKDGNRHELIRGVLVPKMAPGDPHAVVVFRISTQIGIYSDTHNYGAGRTGEPGYRLDRDPDTVRAPDVAWFSPERMPAEGTEGYPELAPDFVVEVKSPSNSNPEMAAKARMWLSYGSRMAVVADPRNSTLTVYLPNAEPVALSENDIFDGGDVMPGFSVEVWRFFRREWPSP